MKTKLISAVLAAALMLVGRPLIAQPVDSPLSLTPTYADDQPSEPANPADEDDLAKKTLNPVADLISVPFQYNMDFNIGPKDARRTPRHGIIRVKPQNLLSLAESLPPNAPAAGVN